jgi:hypothetical protein
MCRVAASRREPGRGPATRPAETIRRPRFRGEELGVEGAERRPGARRGDDCDVGATHSGVVVATKKAIWSGRDEEADDRDRPPASSR